MKTIAEQWFMVELIVLPPEASQLQRREMRRAFYAGYAAACSDLLTSANEAKEQSQFNGHLESVHAESMKFVDDMHAGRT